MTREEMHFELVKSALAGSARLVLSRYPTWAPEYEIDLEDVQDQVFKAMCIANAALSELCPDDKDRVTCVRESCRAPIERGAVICDECRSLFVANGMLTPRDYRRTADEEKKSA